MEAFGSYLARYPLAEEGVGFATGWVVGAEQEVTKVEVEKIGVEVMEVRYVVVKEEVTLGEEGRRGPPGFLVEMEHVEAHYAAAEGEATSEQGARFDVPQTSFLVGQASVLLVKLWEYSSGLPRISGRFSPEPSEFTLTGRASKSFSAASRSAKLASKSSSISDTGSKEILTKDSPMINLLSFATSSTTISSKITVAEPLSKVNTVIFCTYGTPSSQSIERIDPQLANISLISSSVTTEGKPFT